jgi:transcriptional regulator with XRE-family HTH domain
MLKQVMTAQGYTITKLAAAVGLNRSTLGKKLSGKREFYTSDLKAIIPLLNLTQDLGKEIFFPDATVQHGETFDTVMAIGFKYYGMGREHREQGSAAFTLDIGYLFGVDIFKKKDRYGVTDYRMCYMDDMYLFKLKAA